MIFHEILRYPWYIHDKSMNINDISILISWWSNVLLLNELIQSTFYSPAERPRLMAWSGQSISFSLQIGSLRCRDIINSTTSIDMYMYINVSLYTYIHIHINVYIDVLCVKNSIYISKIFIHTRLGYWHHGTDDLNGHLSEPRLPALSVWAQTWNLHPGTLLRCHGKTHGACFLSKKKSLPGKSIENSREIPGKKSWEKPLAKTYNKRLSSSANSLCKYLLGLVDFSAKDRTEMMQHLASQHRTDTLPKTNIATKKGGFQ